MSNVLIPATTEKRTITVEDREVELCYFLTDDGRKFYNATAMWKNYGSPANNRPIEHLRRESTQLQIVEQYRTLMTNSVLKTRFNPDTWVYENMKSLPAAALDPFVITKTGRGGGTYFEELLALDYAASLDEKLKIQILRTFQMLPDLVNAIDEGRTEDAVVALSEVADKVIVKEIEEAGQKATAEKVKARKDGIEVRHILTELIQDMYGKDHPQLRRYLSRVSDAANLACFGVIAEDIQRGLQSSKTRPCFSAAALRAIEYAETAVITGIRHGRLRNIDDMVAELNRLSPLLKMMANTMGDYPLIMENTNVRGGVVNAKGTFQGLLPSGASKVNFAAKQLTSEQV